MQSLPIIIVHQGNQYYLKYCINQLCHSNPQAPIYLLGDDQNKQYEGVTHLAVNDYMKGAREFEKVYRHLSSRPFSYELFCFQRWFIIRDMMQAHGLTACVHLDSDVMVYSDLADVLQPYRSRLMAAFYGMPHVLLFNQLATLADFCTHIMRVYTDPEQLKKLEEKYQVFLDGQAQHGFVGISDMDLLFEYETPRWSQCHELTLIENGGAFDTNLSLSEGYRLDWTKGQKYLKWKQGQPYAYSMAAKRWVKLHALHCQGASKNKMPLLATFPKASLNKVFLQDLIKRAGVHRAKEIYRFWRYGKAYY